MSGAPLCAGGCTTTEAFDGRRKFSAPGAAQAQDGSRDDMLPGGDPINQDVDSCAQTITNPTLPGNYFVGGIEIYT